MFFFWCASNSIRIFKRMRLILFTLISLLPTFFLTAQEVQQGFTAELLAGDLNPVAMSIAPDGRLYIAQKDGTVLIYNGQELLPVPFASIEVDITNERGLSGIAFHPSYEQNNWVYLYYTVPGAQHNRLSRFTANGDVILEGSEEILFELDPLSGTIHNGGAMEFGLDGKLYLAVGDGSEANNSQNANNVLGKILRLNADGTIPSDNPFYSVYSGNARAIWASGFRNPFTMDIAADGRIFVNDVGGGDYEEINEVLSGRNYGWPLIEGPISGQTAPAFYQDPLFAYDHDQGCAILGAAFYDPETLRFPERYHHQFFFADYCEGYIKVLDASGGSVIETFATGINRPLAMEFREDGQMYLLERAGLGGGSNQDNQASVDGALWLISFVDDGRPFIGKQPAPVTVSAGETARFWIIASGDQPLTYTWFKNGEVVGNGTSELLLENVQPADDGAEIYCIVSNASGEAVSEFTRLHVTSNTRPVPEISSPDAAITYAGGDQITFRGSAIDAEDGELSPESFTWWVDFHHDDHTHPALDAVTGITEGTFNVPQVGEISANVWYRIYLKVTDQEGLSQTIFREVYPRTSEITVNSEPQNLLVKVDGRPVSTPYTFIGVEGIIRSISPVKAQNSDDRLYVFEGWEDGFPELIRNYTTPSQDSSILIDYVTVPIGEGSGLKGEYWNQSRTMTGPPDLERTDAAVDFDWGEGSPDAMINTDNFTARWTGKIVPQFTETYRFYVTGDDGIRLYINGSLLIDGWVPQAPTEYAANIDLTAGVPVEVLLEFFEDGGGAYVKLEWESETLPRAILPAAQMYVSSISSVENEKENFEKLSLYPNPVTLICKVVSASPGMLELRDVRGNLLLQRPITETSYLDMTKRAAGIYVLRVISDKGITTRKLIKQ